MTSASAVDLQTVQSENDGYLIMQEQIHALEVLIVHHASMTILTRICLNMDSVLTSATSGVNARRQHGDKTVSALAPAVHRPETAC